MAADVPPPAPPRRPTEAELLWLMVVSGEQAESVLFERGRRCGRAAQGRHRRGRLHAGAGDGPRWPRAWPRRGLEMLDAPVSGGVAGARAAALTIMCSGD